VLPEDGIWGWALHASQIARVPKGHRQQRAYRSHCCAQAPKDPHPRPCVRQASGGALSLSPTAAPPHAGASAQGGDDVRHPRLGARAGAAGLVPRPAPAAPRAAAWVRPALAALGGVMPAVHVLAAAVTVTVATGAVVRGTLTSTAAGTVSRHGSCLSLLLLYDCAHSMLSWERAGLQAGGIAPGL
jgi:hypothetical protein